jgi:hypothetical protein
MGFTGGRAQNSTPVVVGVRQLFLLSATGSTVIRRRAPLHGGGRELPIPEIIKRLSGRALAGQRLTIAIFNGLRIGIPCERSPFDLPRTTRPPTHPFLS